MGVCAAVGAIAGAAIAAGSAVHQAEVKSNYNDYLADQAEADAEARRKAAMVEAERIREAAKQQKSRAVAALAGSGVDVGSETALRIDQTIGKHAEQDAYLTLAAANDEALRMESAAGAYRRSASNDRTAGFVNAGSSLLASSNAWDNYGRGWKRPSSGGRS